jgi:hypothetical protein
MSAASALSSAAPHPQQPAPQPVAAPASGTPTATASVLNIIAKAVGAAVESGALQAAIKQITK